MPLRRFPAAIRALVRTPLVTAIAVVSLALGIGANAAIFSMFDQMLLRPLPVPNPGELVNLSAPGPKPGSTSCGLAGDCEEVFSYPMLRDLERSQTVFAGLAAHRPFSVNLAHRGQTITGTGLLVNGSYFRTLGVKPTLGRLLSPADDGTAGEPHVVVLGHDYWRVRFDANPAVLNDALVVNGQPLTIVGVAPRGFAGTTLGANPSVYVPMTLRDQMETTFKGTLENRRSYWAYLFARLRPGVPLERAMSSINVTYRAILNDVEAPLQKGMSEQTMKQFRERKIGGVIDARGQSDVHREAKTPMILLLSVTGLVLLIACANVANLLLARSARRSAEMAVRLSIGAGRGRLVGQLLTEAALIAALGGALGLLVARWTVDLVLALLPSRISEVMTFSIDARVLAFAFAVTVVTGLLFGLFPALHSTRPNLVNALKGQAGQPSGSRAASVFRTALVTTQVGLSMLLLICAGLFVKSLFNVSRVDLGLRTDRLVTFSVAPALNGYAPPRTLDLFERLENELGALPGVAQASAAMVPVLAGSNWVGSVQVEGFPAGPDTDTTAHFNKIAPGYFKTLGIPLLSGREFTRADAAGAALVAIVNEQFTRKFNLGRNAVGKHIRDGGPESPQIEIVGVVANAKYSEVKNVPPPQYFLPYRQGTTIGFMNFYVRTSTPPDRLITAIPQVMKRVDPTLPVERLRTLEQQVQDNVFLDRLLMVLSASFAGLATLLAAVGLYGVLAYTVAQRTREIGLRMALGAAPPRVRRMILRQMGLMTLIGGAAGLALAAVAGRSAESLLFEIKGYDPMVFGASVVLLGLIAFGAALVPAVRASRVDPMTALRYE